MEEGGEGRGERGRVAKVTKDPQVRTLQQFVRAETEKSQATPAQKSQVTPDRSHKRPLYPWQMLYTKSGADKIHERQVAVPFHFRNMQ